MKGFMLLCVGFLLTGEVSAAEQKRPKMAVFNLRAERGIDEGLVKLLNELLLSEFEKSGKYEVVGWSDIVSMLDLEKQKNLTGCTEEACLVEIGGALGVEYLAVSNMGKIGDYYLLNVKVMDVKRSQVVSRVSRRVSGVENALMDAVVGAVAEVSGKGKQEKAEEKKAAVEKVAEEEAPRAENKALKIAAYAAAGLGAALCGGGIYFGLGARDEVGKAGATTDPKDYDSHSSRSRQKAKAANVLYGVGGALISAGMVLYFW